MHHKFIYVFFIFFFVSGYGNAQIILEQKPAEAAYPSDSSIIPVADKHFKVALFLPFFKDGGDTTGLQHAFAQSSLDYLAGVKVAIDSIEKTGRVVIDFYVEDTELDSSIVVHLLNKEIYRDLDVLIGPIFKSGVEMATPIIQKRNTILYLPFEKNFSFTNQYNIISSQKNTSAFANYFAFFFQKKYSNTSKEFVLIYNSKEGKGGRDARDIDSMIRIRMAEGIDTARIRVVDLSKKENTGFISRLNKRKEYVFFINSKNTYYANEALAQIKLLKSDTPEVYCMDDILESEAPAYETWDVLHVKFFSRFFVDYEDLPTGILRKKIIESYNQDPVEFTYKGYNDVLFLSQAFISGDKWISQCLNKEYVNEVSGFYYSLDNISLGIFNGYHGIWRYENLKIYRVY